MERILRIGYILFVLIAAVVASHTLARFGEPQSVWLWGLFR